MHKEHVGCREVMNHICDNLGEDLNSPKCVAIKEHLENCDSCKKYFKSVEDTIKFYKLYNVELSDESHKNLMKKLGLE
jgi:predicted anti-sigma-YlaC factor YlaD